MKILPPPIPPSGNSTKTDDSKDWIKVTEDWIVKYKIWIGGIGGGIVFLILVIAAYVVYARRRRAAVEAAMTEMNAAATPEAVGGVDPLATAQLVRRKWMRI